MIDAGLGKGHLGVCWVWVWVMRLIIRVLGEEVIEFKIEILDDFGGIVSAYD